MLLKKIAPVVIIIGLMVPAVSGSDSTINKNNPEKNAKEQTFCPVMEGRKINKNLYVDHQGKRIFVCCNGCIDQVKKDPEKFIRKLEKDGQQVQKIQSLLPQKTCPVMGGTIDRELFVDYKHQRIYVCCSGCIGELKKNPEIYLNKLSSRGEMPEKIRLD